MGEVYRALDTRVDRIVAVKVLPPEAAEQPERRQRFEREARAVARLNHPHICALYDVGQQDGLEFLVMEYLEGETLAARLACGPLPLDEALKHSTALAQALARAHREGITHRDIKPSNVMLTDGGVKLLDFGLAKLREGGESPVAGSPLDDQSTGVAISPEGTLIGTIAYMSPEQLEGRVVDSRTDIYALGLIVYEMITGQRAFAKGSQAGLIAAILKEDPPPMTTLQPKTPPAVERIIITALAKDPAKRWQDAGDLARELSWVITDSDATTTNRKPPVLKPVWRPWTFAAGVVILAAIGTSGVVWRIRSSDPANSARFPMRSLVVLPCRVIGGDLQGQAYCDGLAETLTAKLTPLTVARALPITPASEVRQRGVVTASDARRAFGATLAIEGSVSADGHVIRLNYALVDTATLQQLDALSMTAATDPFAVQDEVVGWAVRVLALTPSGSEHAELTARNTVNPSVYELYLQGLGYLLNAQRPSNVDSAIELFEHALALDPNHAPAHAGLGRAQWQRYQVTHDPIWVERARHSCAKAVELDAQLPEAAICLGTLENGTGDFQRAMETFTRALSQDPTNDLVYVGLARTYEHLGDDVRAEATYHRAVALRPQYWATRDRLGTFYRERSRYAEAAEQFRIEVELTPDNPQTYLSLGTQYGMLGQYQESLAAFEHSAQLQPSFAAYANLGMTLFRLRRFDDAAESLKRAQSLRADEYAVVSNLARIYYWTGRRAEAQPLYEKAISLGEAILAVNPHDVSAHLTLADCASKLGRRHDALKHLDAAGDVRRNPHELFFVALVHSQLGDADTALNYLNQAIAGGLPTSELRAWIDLDHLRDDPRFRALVNRKTPRG
jgi:eukaryotic-like serine/threonine-protein kinase